MDELGPREREILRAIVQEHVATGGPVGSSAIAGHGVDASPATVRSVMADLEALGFLGKPHTSAGRVPTDLGYRYFVDSLLQLRPPTRSERDLIERTLPPAASADQILQETSRLLSTLSHHAAVVSVPSLDRAPLKRLEFIKLREDRILAVLMSAAGLVHNRVMTVSTPFTEDELDRAADYLNQLLADTPIEAVRERIVLEMSRDRTEYDELAQKTLLLGQRALEPPHSPAAEVLIQGRESFFEAPEFTDHERMRSLFRALEERSRLLVLLDRTLVAGEVQIFIGAETDFSARSGVALVAAPYVTREGVVGALGVIGPTRMNYNRVIALVDYTARAVSRLLDRT